MGRTFENRKNAIAKRGARDAKAFTKAGRQISIAVKASGSDPSGNPALRRAIQNARAANMPKDKIQKAIEKASGASQSESFEEILYEGYGPHGIAFMVETATDNPTRTVANIRSYFKKEGGNLGTSGSVGFMFDQFGVFLVNPDALERDELELELIDHGLERFEDGTGEDGKPVWLIFCSHDGFGTMQSALEEHKVSVVSSGFKWVAKSTTEISEQQSEEVAGLFDRLEDDDDVQEVFCNIEVAEAG